MADGKWDRKVVLCAIPKYNSVMNNANAPRSDGEAGEIEDAFGVTNNNNPHATMNNGVSLISDSNAPAHGGL